MKIIDQYAILYVQEANLHSICSKLNWPESLYEIYRKHRKKIDNFTIMHFPQQISLCGYCEDNNISHYRIDDDIRNKFNKKDAQPDSESGWFNCYTNEKTVDKLKKFLNKKYPLLKFTVSIDENDRITPFSNWQDAKKYVEKNQLEIPDICEEGNSLIINNLKTFNERIKAIEKEREGFLNNLK